MLRALRTLQSIGRALKAASGDSAITRALLLVRCRAWRGQPMALRRAWRGLALTRLGAKGGHDRFRVCPLL